MNVNFRRLLIGHAASLLGSSMASLAIAFAVLQNGGGPSEAGVVMTARVVPIVLALLLGGVVADRLGGRRVMLATEALRCLVQAVLALALLGRPDLWTVTALVALWGVGEALFLPSMEALVPRIVADSGLADANSVLGTVRSVATVAGPALAGLLTTTVGPALVVALDSATFAVGFFALLRLPATAREAAPEPSLLAELREGWAEFTARRWIWVTSLQMGLFNLLVWAPFLVLGPAFAQRHLGGARGWGLVMTVHGLGAAAGGLLMLRRRPRRPVVVATLATLGWALPSAALATDRPMPWICAAALLAGLGSTVSGSLYATMTQREVPPEAVARVSAYGTLGAFALGPLGLALAGPLAAELGIGPVLGFGALWQTVAAALVLAVLARDPQPAGERPADGRPQSADDEPAGSRTT